MPCNLAVTITKAAITSEQLRSLLTPDIVTQMLTTYFQSQGYELRADSFHDEQAGTYFSITRQYGRVQCRVSGFFGIDIFVEHGQVTVNGTHLSQQGQVDDLLTQVSTLLVQAADLLFARQVQTALQSLGQPMTTETVTVNNQGTTQSATVFTLRI
jgi:hypothetical protein